MTGNIRLKIKITMLCIAAVMAAATVSSAFWTDRIEMEQEIKAYDIGIDYEDESLNGISESPYIPGDIKGFSFAVINSGDISVDIKPVISITASKDMIPGSSGFIITDAGGEEISGYEKKYIDESGKELTKEDIEEGKAYRTLIYTKADEEVLAGSSQQDESIGELETRRDYSYGLKLLEDTDNSFAGAEAVIDISTYAIQHRNREASGEWISIVEER